ncbi:hypothetical protein AB0J28_15240, partial [Streptosporangium canum]|uniref:hypothetical protein n=1 Tax=Streptosporangium canum TaxID=324952 RepID=UPI0034210B09
PPYGTPAVRDARRTGRPPYGTPAVRDARTMAPYGTPALWGDRRMGRRSRQNRVSLRSMPRSPS